ncbi:hypothetical protein [Enterococcus sp. AZ126]|uniref:hypothetical protein n=1 Tax=Enterococcus sp. AZ126 TaxID=2774635 RepID=UPI003F688318
MTPDRGPEFAQYNDFSKLSDLDYNFAYPGSSWQRGTNENTNRLIREYLPKCTDMTLVSEGYIESAIYK